MLLCFVFIEGETRDFPKFPGVFLAWGQDVFVIGSRMVYRGQDYCRA